MKSKRSRWPGVILLALILLGGSALLVYRSGWLLPDIQPTEATPTLDPLPYFVTGPEFPFWMNERTREEKRQEWLDDLTARAQTLYERPDCGVRGEITNPLFTRVFPHAHLYEAGHRDACTHYLTDERCYMRMAALKGKDYRLPEQFNELLYDAGYALTEKNFDQLAQALIVLSVPTGVAMRPITCEEGEDLVVDAQPADDSPYVYAIRCQLAYENYTLVIKFPESVFTEGQFTGWTEGVYDAEGDYVNMGVATYSQRFPKEE